MGLFDFGKGKEIKKLSEQVQALQSMNNFNSLSNINKNIAVYPNWDVRTQAERYATTDDIYSIIRLLATTAALVPLYAYLQTQDQKAFQNLRREIKGWRNPFKFKSLQTKALEDLPDDDPVAMLIENPHQHLSKYEFFEAIYSYLLYAGECFILKQRPEFGTNHGLPIQLHLMHPENVILLVSSDLPRTIGGFRYVEAGKVIQDNIPLDDVIHVKYFNPEISNMGAELRGLSPLKVLKKRLVRMDSGFDTSVAQLQNAGVPGIVYDKTFPDQQAVDIVGKRQQNFYKYLSNTSNKGMPYFASGEMGYIQLGMNLADLSVAELGNVDFKKLCNVFGVSDVLFNSSDAATETNVLIQTKRLYTNTVLPNVYRVRDALIKGLLPDFKNGVLLTDQNGEPIKIKGDGKDRYIDADISDITELHEDLGRRAVWMQQAYWLTPNEKREMMNYDRYDDTFFDQPLIPTGLMSLQDLEMLPPVTQATPNGN